MKKLLSIGLFLCTLITLNAYAYNSNGHRAVAQIAYDNLTPEAKGEVGTLITVVGQFYSINTFVDGAPWADWLKSDNVTAYNNWHYIDQPIIQGNCEVCQMNASATVKSAFSAQPPNVVWAIQQAEQVLTTPASSRYPQQSSFEKSMFLLFLEHFVGDIHQPLHAVELYSRAYPTGDQGGNLYRIHSTIADNLHSFWDQGGGVFPSSSMTDGQIKMLAAQIEKKYPQGSLQGVSDLVPVDWAAESKNIAQTFVYTLPANTAPTMAYVHKTRTISEQRVALAGYRLAGLLNQFFG